MVTQVPSNEMQSIRKNGLCVRTKKTANQLQKARPPNNTMELNRKEKPFDAMEILFRNTSQREIQTEGRETKLCLICHE